MRSYAPTISLSPSITCATSSTEARPIFFPKHFAGSVLIWLILTHERFGNSLWQILPVLSRFLTSEFWLLDSGFLSFP